MKIVNATALVVLICATQAGLNVDGQVPSSKAAPAQPVKWKWPPGVYRGLKIGKSTKADVLKVLGKPAWTGKESESLTPMMEFYVSEPVAGRLAVLFQRGVVAGFRLAAKEPLTKADLVKIFGAHYITVHYSSDDCLGEGGTAPIYQDPDGELEYIEYRARGISANVLNNGDVEEICFGQQGPLGPSHSHCPKQKKKKSP